MITTSSSIHTSKKAIVLSGGGARGAYEVGVLKYLFKELPIDTQQLKFDIISGTSVGAIHAAFLAGHAHNLKENIHHLENAWMNLSFSNTLEANFFDQFRIILQILQLVCNRPSYKGLFLNTPYIIDMITKSISWPDITKNIESGDLSALTISATHIASGLTKVFIQNNIDIKRWSRDKRVVPVKTDIHLNHVLASASTPFLFSPIKIDQQYHCDGGLRQNTPVSPAIRLGADKILIISTSMDTRRKEKTWSQEVYPEPYDYFGKIFNALLLDHLDYDLARLRGFNEIIEKGTEAFGQNFLDKLNESSIKIRGAKYKKIDYINIRPKSNLGEVSQKVFEEHRNFFPYYLRKFISSHHPESDFLSYLLFDHSFAEQLIEIGFQDAKAHQKELVDFFCKD